MKRYLRKLELNEWNSAVPLSAFHSKDQNLILPSAHEYTVLLGPQSSSICSLQFTAWRGTDLASTFIWEPQGSRQLRITSDSFASSGGSPPSPFEGLAFSPGAWASSLSLCIPLLLTAVSFSCFHSFVLLLFLQPYQQHCFLLFVQGRWRRVFKVWGMGESVLISCKLRVGKCPCYTWQSTDKISWVQMLSIVTQLLWGLSICRS